MIISKVIVLLAVICVQNVQCSWILYDKMMMAGESFVGNMSIIDCIRYCSGLPVCEAINHKRSDQTCRTLDQARPCSELQPNNDFIHYSKRACVNATTTTVAVPTTTTAQPVGTFTEFQNTYVNGTSFDLGNPGISKDECTRLCDQSSVCLAVDYVVSFGQCYGYDANFACGQLVSGQLVIHLKKVDCSTFSPPQTTPSPTSTAVPIIPGYTTFDEKSVSGSIKNLVNVTLTQCADACKQDVDCVSADFHKLFNQCFFHPAGSACTAFSDNRDVVHLRGTNCP